MESIPRKDDVSVIAGTARRNVAAGKGTARSLFSRSDSEILDLTSATHVPDHPQEHTSSDVSSLLSTTEVIIVGQTRLFLIFCWAYSQVILSPLSPIRQSVARFHTRDQVMKLPSNKER
ncbi:uncharacterized protein [Pyrus communis]|uniref:uncharacterized protein n=1 Tax=Pyrus communis TaxID=23211 RepID=UPI0035BFFE88